MNASDIEIMAPVGSYESLMAAIQGGADAVYFGAGKLNMRSRSSQNFTIDDLQKIASICTENNKRSYLTLNTIIFDEELDAMREYVDAAVAAGISAVIASDIAVISYAHRKGMEVHISTQCNITNIEEVRFYAQWADVMVTARELTLKQVKSITMAIARENICGPSGRPVQIEIFAHGALCMAVSGKCYLSLDNLNSSANRGACLQPCRRGYTVKEKGGEYDLDIDNQYIMSPKDLKTLDFIDKILDAGVRVLKIEGRGRPPEYVKTVSSVYRAAVDAWVSGEFNQEKLAAWNDKLDSVYNRGFWDGYYLGRKTGEWSAQYGSKATKKRVFIGKVTNYFSKLGVAELKVETKYLALDDEIHIVGPTTGVYEDVLKEIRLELDPVPRAQKGDLCSIPVSQMVRRNDKLYKIVDADDELCDITSKA